jgi:hypothetical protein
MYYSPSDKYQLLQLINDLKNICWSRQIEPKLIKKYAVIIDIGEDRGWLGGA